MFRTSATQRLCLTACAVAAVTALALIQSATPAAVISVTGGDMPIITGAGGETFTGDVTLTGDLNVSVGAFDYVVVGGGGGGGAGKGNSDMGCGGGGGGGVNSGTLLLNGQTSFTVTVGNGGVHNYGGDNGDDGGDSKIVGTGVNLLATGGKGGGGMAIRTVATRAHRRARRRPMLAVTALTTEVVAVAEAQGRLEMTILVTTVVRAATVLR